MNINSEQERLEELKSYGILEQDIHEELEGLTELASTICETPISMINLLNSEHQVTKASVGWDVSRIAKENSFCQYTIEDTDLTVVENAEHDDRFNQSPFVKSDPNIRFYAGMPLRTSKGNNLGVICVIDNKPRELTESQKNTLRLLADEAVSRLELIKKKKELEQRNRELEKSEVFIRNSSDIQAIIDPESLNILEVSNEATRILGGQRDDFVGKDFGNRFADSNTKEQILSFLNQRDKREESFIAPVRDKEGSILYLTHTFSWHDGKWFMTARDVTEREGVRQTLRKRSQAIEASIDGIAILDNEFFFEFLNDAHAQIFGYKKEELLGERWELLYHRDERKSFKSEVHAQLEYYEQWRGETTGLRKDGSHFPVEISLSKLESGKTICIARDITERINTQKKLKQTLTNLSIGQELAEVGSWTWDVQSDDIKWSEKVYDICGVKNISQKPTLDLFLERTHPKDQELVADIIEKVRTGEEIGEFEHRLRLPDGTEKWVRHSGRVTYNASSTPLEVNGAIQDITKQKKAQLKLQREKELSDKIINSMPTLFFMFDKHGNAIRWNDQLRKETGYNEQQIAYSEPLDYFPDDQKEKISTAITKVFQGQNVTIEADFWGKNKDRQPYLFNATPFNMNGDTYMIGTGLNISELKEYQDKLTSSLKEKEVLLSEIHHRVKNNLAIISGLLQLESFRSEDEYTKDILQNSQLRIQSMATVHEMLYDSEDFNNLAFDNFVSNIVDAVRNVHQSIEDIAFDMDIEDVSLNVNQAIPCGLIINELITNAYKHAFDDGESGKINVSLTLKDGMLTLQVSDNGHGLPEDFSLSSASSMGFTLIKTLVQQLEADISLQSQNGTAVEITFEKAAKKGASSSLSVS